MTGENDTTISDLREKIEEFVSEREWEKFHTPKNLAEAICIEATELLEVFQWIDSNESRKVAEKDKKRVREELADVMIYCLALANSVSINLSNSIIEKIEKNAKKYPRGKYLGKART